MKYWPFYGNRDAKDSYGAYKSINVLSHQIRHGTAW